MKQIVSILIIISVVYSAGFSVFIKKAEATTSFGSVVGSAVGAGVACWADFKLEAWLAGLLSEPEAKGEVYTRTNTTLGLTSQSNALASGAAADATAAKELVANVPTYSATQFYSSAALYHSLTAQNEFTKAVIESTENIAKKAHSDKALDNSKSCMRDVVVKKLLDWLVDQVVDWIQNGGDLSSRFVTDWNSFSDDAFNTAAGAIIEEALPLVCSSFSAQFELTLGNPVEKFGTQIGCTLDDVVENIDNFYDDFTSADDPWLAYNTMWQPQNNFFGATIMTKDKALNEGVKNQANKLNNALAGGGFIASQQCKTSYAVAADSYGSYCPNSATRTDSSGKTKCSVAYEKDVKGNYCQGSEMEVVTPGSTVGSMVANMANMDTWWAANTKSWIAAIVNAGINRMMKEGVAYMTKSDEGTDSSNDYDPSAEETSTASDYFSTATPLQPITINDGDETTNSLDVSLTIDASAAGMSDAVYMKVSEKSDFSDVIYGPYEISAVATLSSGAGTKTLYVKFKDGDDNETTGTYSDSIEYGTASTAIAINSGDEKTIYASTTLTINASAAGMSDVSNMMISEDKTFADSAKGDTTWQSYFSSKSWDIKSCDSSNYTATVYVKFQNNSGDVVGDDGSLSDSITLSGEAKTTLCVATP